MQIASSWGKRGTAGIDSPLENHFICADWKISDWLIKITFLVNVETTIRLGIKSRFGIMGLSTSDTIWSLWFFSLI